jgi:hypothetical protein
MKILLITLLIFFSDWKLSAATFNFNKDLQEWGAWGDGLSSHDGEVGHSSRGSVWLSADWGENQTFHYHWNNLRPGLYKVKAYVRARNVQTGSDGASFWHFYDGGKGTENVFTELNGSYEWRKIEYTLAVQKNDLSIWFRLKAPGQVWIDDISIEEAKVALALSIEPGLPFKGKAVNVQPQMRSKKEVVILDFDKVNRAHPFSSATSPNGHKVGRLASHKYYNFDPSSFLAGDWSSFDRIQMDIYNGNSQFVEYYLTLTDNLTTNYWSQLNHKTHLAPGWNHLSFSLSQFLGERGSHRFNRALNLKKLQKWFIVLDHSEKFKENSNFFIDNLKLSYDPAPLPAKGIVAFDFTSHRDHVESGYQKVTTQDLYHPDVGFGFVAPKFWRVEDSQWVGTPLQYSIGMLSGHFKTKLPNGRYKMNLSIERLGFWDVSFWNDRTVYINGKPVFKESRSSGKDYLQDLLQFEKLVPGLQDHPFDLYLKKLFKPLEFSFQVTNGEMNLEFEGDPTGISLNSLVIWKAEDEDKARNFLAASDKRLRLEFDWMTRSLNTVGKKLPDQLISVIDPSLTLKPNSISPELGRKLKFQGGIGERPYQLIQLRGNGEVSWKLSDLKNSQGKKISGSDVIFSELVPQYISPDLNHETYLVAGKFLKPIRTSSLEQDGESTKYLWIQFPLKTGTEPGVYQGELSFSSGVLKSTFPVELKVSAYELPALTFPVGFFGPDPINHSYFAGEGLDKIRSEYRLKAIKFLGDSGFTTLTGLPEVKLEIEGSDWSLDTTEVNEVITAANRAGMSKVYFSYGGKFPQSLLDVNNLPAGMTQEAYAKKLSPLLNAYLQKSGMPKIVHTFSDEAGGYSDKVNEDLSFAKKLKAAFPFMLRGGFGSKSDPATRELNTYFDYGIFSNVSKNQLQMMGRNSKWGSYNASPGNLDDPRFSFGPGLFYAHKAGLSQYLEWHASAVNNYPYYDLDGRESDVVMFLPTSDGELYPTLRFELATEGLHLLRKLLLLEKALAKDSGSGTQRAREWLQLVRGGAFSSSENIMKPSSSFQLKDFISQLDKHLSEVKIPVE